MRYGLQFPPMGEFADPFLLAELARAAEAAGWDGFFSWDAVIPHWPADLLDPTVAVAVIAMQTTRLRCGILVTPLPRRRPWKFARETAALDRLSGGRLVVGVGTGGDPAEFDEVGDEPSARIRGQMLDEGLALLTGLWSGEPYRHEGDRHDGGHYRIGEVTFTPRPVQVPRPPIWVGGQWPNPKPARRAARWDGYHPLDRDNFAFARMMSVELMREAVAFVRAERAALDIAPDAPFDFIHSGITPGGDPAADATIVVPYAEAGVTWWMEQLSPWVFGWSEGDGAWPVEAMRARVEAGPPGKGS